MSSMNQPYALNQLQPQLQKLQAMQQIFQYNDQTLRQKRNAINELQLQEQNKDLNYQLYLKNACQSIIESTPGVQVNEQSLNYVFNKLMIIQQSHYESQNISQQSQELQKENIAMYQNLYNRQFENKSLESQIFQNNQTIEELKKKSQKQPEFQENKPLSKQQQGFSVQSDPLQLQQNLNLQQSQRNHQNNNQTTQEQAQQITQQQKSQQQKDQESQSFAKQSDQQFIQQQQVQQILKCMNISCQSQFTSNDIIQLNCQHTFCKTCFIDYLKLKTEGKVIWYQGEISYNITCLVGKCSQIVRVEDVQAALDNQTFAHYQKESLKRLNDIQTKQKQAQIQTNQQNQQKVKLPEQKQEAEIKVKCGNDQCLKKLINKQDIVILQCQHQLCKDCFVAYLMKVTNDKIICNEGEYGFGAKCMIKSCQKQVQMKDIQKALDQENFSYYFQEAQKRKQDKQNQNKGNEQQIKKDQIIKIENRQEENQ